MRVPHRPYATSSAFFSKRSDEEYTLYLSGKVIHQRATYMKTKLKSPKCSAIWLQKQT